jgi:hypothetical protein
MFQRRFSLFAVGSGLALTAACASVLGIEDATCDPSYDPDCASDNGDSRSSGSGSEETAALPNLGVGGSVASAGSANGVGAAGTAPTPSGGAGGASSAATNNDTANGGTAGSSMAAAGAAGTAAVATDPFEARASTLCREYCATVTANCTGTNQQYASSTACYAVCELLPPGTAGDTTPSNTVQCRLRRAALAGTTGEPSNYCFSSGPGGAEECGSDCDGFCALMTQKCADDMGPLNECLSACNIVPDLSRPPDNLRYNVSQQSGDSLQCRLFHVSAATVDPSTHCIHAAGGSPCSL